MKDQWGHNVSDAEARRGSAVLRRLLVEDAYGTAWRAAGFEKEPSLIAVSLDVLLAATPLNTVVHALAAGANFRGIQMAGTVLARGANSIRPAFTPPLTPDGYPGEAVFTLSRFLSSMSGVTDGRTFTRREVIKYIANVKGGVHLSAQQRKAERKLIERLGKIEKKITVHTSDGLIVELVAIGQALARSSDALAYVERVAPDGV
ncbi:MAG: hypothetical protein AB7P44_10725 [Steroidobacteraceae bacterium]